MSNITDYVRWYSDFDFTAKPFSEADNLVFCRLAYADFSSASGHDRRRTVREALSALDERDDFLQAASSSARFGSLIVSDYTEIYDKQNSVQFSAVTFHIDSHTRFVAFRGTDGTLTGWKEDFMISYTSTAAQENSVAYLENAVSNDTVAADTVFYIGGHSKGGNLALYSSCHARQDVLDSVKHIYNP